MHSAASDRRTSDHPHAHGGDPETTPVIVACCRTAIAAHDPQRGFFRHVRADELAAAVIRAAVERSGVDPATIDEVVLGAVEQRGPLGGNAARSVALLAGLPDSVGGVTVNRLAASSLQALAQASHAIAAGAARVQVASGVEHMHHLPSDPFGEVHPRALKRSSRGVLSPGLVAERLASVHGIDRRRQEDHALASHARAKAAADAGLFDEEIVPVPGHDDSGAVLEVATDQLIGFPGDRTDLARLDPVYLPGTGTITAATSAPAAVGSAALVVTSLAEADRQGLSAWARVIGTAVAGVPPAAAGTGAVAAIGRLLAGNLRPRDLEPGSFDHVELEEAFAAETLYALDTLGLDPARVNPRGGSLALGLPLGAGGARMATTLLHAMRDAAGARFGLLATSVSLGQGIALLLERLPD
jgi:acetyl-CoA acyltransferase